MPRATLRSTSHPLLDDLHPPRGLANASERKLMDLAGVGRSIAGDLDRLGVRSVSELAACSGDELYKDLCALTGTRQDPCVLDVFRCAVAQARDLELPEEQKNWWWWSRQRKAGLIP
jgi:hypothetical protein